MTRLRSCTRRGFLKRSAMLACAPAFVSSRALGSAPGTSANGRLALGLIGVGNMGSAHLDGFLGRDDVRIAAICDVDAVKRGAAQQRVDRHYSSASGTCAGHNEYEELLARDDVDAVVIAVPDHWHAIVAIAACAAGKDVYCEKPLSLTIREARAMAAAARRYGTVFQTGSQQRSDALFRRACELVRNGRIGRLVTVRVGIGGPSQDREFAPEPVREGLDWDRWLGPAPWKPYNAERCSGSYSGGWRLVRDYSGGMTTDWGAHHFDIAQWGMGADDTGPVEILPPGHAGLEDLTYRYAGGVVMQRGGANGVRFIGSEGEIEVNRGHFRTTPDSIGREPENKLATRLYASDDHRGDWLACVRARRRPICDVEIGCRSVTVCHLGNIACWLNRPIRWDPGAERILDDAVASRWLDRARRAGYRLPC